MPKRGSAFETFKSAVLFFARIYGILNHNKRCESVIPSRIFCYIQLSVALFPSADNARANSRTAANKQQGNPQSRVACVAGLRKIIDLSVVDRQISHRNDLRMRCRISRNRHLGIENLTIICADFNRMRTRFQINRVCYFLTIHFNDYIRQLSRRYNKRNRIFQRRQNRRSVWIKPIIAASSSDFIKEILSFHISKRLCCTCFRMLTASRNIFRFDKIVVFKNR